MDSQPLFGSRIRSIRESASLSRELVALHAHMVAADAALAVEQGGGRNPSAVALDLFEEDDAGLSWHLAIPRRGRWPVPV
jgi:transcriptional regulator with XRE-family HTH domain